MQRFGSPYSVSPQQQADDLFLVEPKGPVVVAVGLPAVGAGGRVNCIVHPRQAQPQPVTVLAHGLHRRPQLEGAALEFILDDANEVENRLVGHRVRACERRIGDHGAVVGHAGVGDGEMLPPLARADFREPVRQLAVQAEVAKQNRGRTAGVEVQNVGQAEENSQERQVHSLAILSEPPGNLTALAFEPEPLHRMVVAEGEKLQWEGETDILQRPQVDLPQSRGHASPGLAGMAGSHIVRNQVVLDERGAMVLARRAQAFDQPDLLREAIAMALIGGVAIDDRRAFFRGERHAEVVDVSRQDRESTLQFAEALDSIRAKQRLHPSDHVQDVSLVVQRVERHVVNDGGEEGGGFGSRFRDESQ